MRRNLTVSFFAAFVLAVSLTGCGEKNLVTSVLEHAKSGAEQESEAEEGSAETATEKGLKSLLSGEKASAEPVSLDDAKQPADKDFIYDEFKGWVELHGYQGKDDVILIPTEIDGQPVECSGLVLEANTHVRGIVLAEGYTEIPWIGAENEEDAIVEAIRIPASCTELGNSPSNPFQGLPALRTIEVAEGNPVYFVEDGLLYGLRGDSKLLMCYPPQREGETYVQPEGVYLVSSVFANNPYLKRVENANSWIDGGSFLKSSVEEVVCSESWTYLTQHAFSDFTGESKLRSITLSPALDSHAGKTDIFSGLDQLEEILVPEENEKYFSDDGVLYFYYKDTEDAYLLLYPNARPGEEYTPPEQAVGIYYSDYAFDNPLYLKKLHKNNLDLWAAKLPEGVEVVE